MSVNATKLQYSTCFLAYGCKKPADSIGNCTKHKCSPAKIMGVQEIQTSANSLYLLTGESGVFAQQ